MTVDKYADLRDAVSYFDSGELNGRDWIVLANPDTIRAMLAERDALRVALEDELAWHEAQDKAISKQPNANTGHNWWRRAQHQEHAVVIRAALGQGQGGQHDNQD